MSCHLSFTPFTVHTSTTTDTIKENSGSLINIFDAEAVQNELDELITEFRTSPLREYYPYLYADSAYLSV